jgi:hypothetical protein
LATVRARHCKVLHLLTELARDKLSILFFHGVSGNEKELYNADTKKFFDTSLKLSRIIIKVSI